MLLDLVRDTSDPLRAALLRGMSEVSLARREIEGHPGTYETEPVDITALRQCLFQAALGRGEKAEFARELLDKIDSVRDALGRPLSEARHPDIASGRPWPFEARDAWATTFC